MNLLTYILKFTALPSGSNPVRVYVSMANTAEYFNIAHVELINLLLVSTVIVGQNNPVYKLLPTSVIWTPRSTPQAKQQTKIQNFKN